MVQQEELAHNENCQQKSIATSHDSKRKAGEEQTNASKTSIFEDNDLHKISKPFHSQQTYQQQEREETKCQSQEKLDGRTSQCSREVLNSYWMQKFQFHGISIRDAVAQTGSVEDLVWLIQFLFETKRVETFAMDLFLDFWDIFPEQARSLIYLFQEHSCWQQLFLWMERAKRCKQQTMSDVLNASFQLLREQWQHDLLAIERTNACEVGMDGPSDLALWMPSEKKYQHWNDFVQLFLKKTYRRCEGLAHTGREYTRDMMALRLAAEVCVSYKCLKGDTIKFSSTKVPDLDNAPSASGRLCSSRKFFGSTKSAKLHDTRLIFQPTDALNSSVTIGLVKDARCLETLFQQPNIYAASEKFLSKGHRHFHALSSERVLYIHQGEIGHATPDQCDIIMSDRATTCHIMSIQSQSLSNRQSGSKLFSLTHLDSARYTECVLSAIKKHIVHNNISERIELIIDVVGGFGDDRQSSFRISTWLLGLFAFLADELPDTRRIRFRTCSISLWNESDEVGSKGPIGRGLGIDLRTGEAFTASADRSIIPGMQLRSARIWAGGGGGRLGVVHIAATDGLMIHPFQFCEFDRLSEYLEMPDNIMIQKTSTSPDVEESDFCASVRKTLRFMKEIDCRQVFGSDLDQPVRFQRIGQSNIWQRQ